MQSSSLAPLKRALELVDSWLIRDGTSRMIVAAPTIEELQLQELPEHIRVTPKKRRGARKAMRGRQHYHESHFKLARWPEDALDENALPSLACVLRGEADLNIADYVLHCRAGDWILFPAGVPKQDGSKPHFEGDPAGRECEILWFSPGLGLMCWICYSRGDQHGKDPDGRCVVRHQFLRHLFEGFCDEAQHDGRAEITTHLLRGVLLLLRGEIAAGRAVHQWRPEVEAGGERSDPITEAMRYIDENLNRSLTIASVARQVLVSPATLTRRFREHTGQTFHHYLNAQRLKQASALLTDTDLALTHICSHVGLKYCQLRNLFQKHYDCSPGEYRKRKR